MTKVLALLVLLGCSLPVQACAWDSDTLEAEAEGVPDTIRVITGRFERNPALYYEMRLARVAKQLESTPEELELYDDAGVASDRLHRGDEAVVWMEKKRAQMENSRGAADSKVLSEHRYRYLANLGTFLAHRWLRGGADRKEMSDIKRGRDLIAAAIELNPDAHFGREKYQLQVMEWIINPPKANDGTQGLPHFLEDFEWDAASEAVEGLSGLIVLGDAWQSVDVFNALATAIQRNGRRSSVAYLARLRASELVSRGQSSVLPGAPKATALEKALRDQSTYEIRDSEVSVLRGQFLRLRQEADAWHAQRTAYMVERMQAGRHPDTDTAFWNEWQEPEPPSLYVATPQERWKKYGIIGAAVFSTILLSLLALKFARRRRSLA